MRSFLLFLSFALPLWAQFSIPPPTDSPYRFSSDFLKQSSTWNWSGMFQASGGGTASPGWNVHETFSSNLLLPGAGTKQWKDEHRLNASFFSPLRDDLLFGLQLNSWMQNNRQSGPNNNFSNHGAAFFSDYRPATGLSLQPYIGYQRARNIDKVDWGWDVGAEASWKRFKLDSYGGQISGFSHYDFYDQRQNYNNRGMLHIGTQFTAYAADSLRFYYEESVKQSYDSRGENLLEARLYDRGLENSLYYTVSPRNRILLNTKILSKNVSYFTNRDVFFVENDVRYAYFGSRLSFMATFRTSDETLDNDGLRTDSRTRQSALGLRFSYVFNGQYIVNGNFDYIKLQHDTVDETNNDDRDEQRFVFNLSLKKRLSELLNLELRLYGYFFHQIYLFKERSANNNWNRVLKFEPITTFRSRAVTNRLSAQVIANFTIYDFDNLLPTKRSFIVRRFSLSDSLVYHLPKGFESGFKGRVELEEKGSFFKKDFAQNLVQTIHNYYLSLFVSRRFFRRAQISTGYSFYERNEWRHIPVKRKSRLLQNRGPYLSFSYRVQDRLVIAAQTSLNYLSDSSQRNFSYSSGHLNLLYNF